MTRDRLAFHSLRKNFGTALDRAGIPPTDREALLGHSRGFSLDVYSTGPGLKRLKKMVEAVSYPLGNPRAMAICEDQNILAARRDQVSTRILSDENRQSQQNRWY